MIHFSRQKKTYSKFNRRLIKGGSGNIGEAAELDPSGTIKGRFEPAARFPACPSLLSHTIPLSPLESPT